MGTALNNGIGARPWMGLRLVLYEEKKPIVFERNCGIRSTGADGTIAEVHFAERVETGRRSSDKPPCSSDIRTTAAAFV
jgi:hypothetical protein